jgi:hypothetical protein
LPRRNSKSVLGNTAARPRNSRLSVSMSQETVPNLPHERDESADSQGGEPKKVIRRAAADLKRGQQDTDRGAQMNQVYKKLKRGRQMPDS